MDGVTSVPSVLTLAGAGGSEQNSSQRLSMEGFGTLRRGRPGLQKKGSQLIAQPGAGSHG